MTSPSVSRPSAFPSNAQLLSQNGLYKETQNEPNQSSSQRPRTLSVNAGVSMTAIKNLGKWAVSTSKVDRWSPSAHASLAAKPSFADRDRIILSTPQKPVLRKDSGKSPHHAAVKDNKSPLNLPPHPGHPPIHVSRDDPGWASRRNRDFYALNDRYEHRRQGEVANKLPLKKASKVKPSEIQTRRKDVFIPTNLTVAMLAKLLNVKLCMQCYYFRSTSTLICDL